MYFAEVKQSKGYLVNKKMTSGCHRGFPAPSHILHQGLARLNWDLGADGQDLCPPRWLGETDTETVSMIRERIKYRGRYSPSGGRG